MPDPHRVNRARLAASLDAWDRAARPKADRGAVYVGQVYGVTGTVSGPRVVDTRPIAISASEASNATVTVTPDTSRSVAVYVTRGSVANGTNLVARLRDGRWVAATKAAPAVTRQLCIVLFPTCNALATGAPVEVSQGGVVLYSGTADAANSICFSVPAGTYQYSVSWPYWQTATGSVTVGSLNVTRNVGLVPVAGRVGCRACPGANYTAPTTLEVTDAHGTTTLGLSGCGCVGSRTISIAGYTAMNPFIIGACDFTSAATISWPINYELACLADGTFELRKTALVCSLAEPVILSTGAESLDLGIGTAVPASCDPFAASITTSGAIRSELNGSATISE
jgi:hypothetical protein